MSTIKTDIIPKTQIFVGGKQTLDQKAICVFAATGFFLDDDTYFNELKVLKPAYHYSLDTEQRQIISAIPYFEWHYSPIERPLKQIVEEFAHLFETIIKEQVEGQSVILPLSGGLDSRTQAAALHYLGIPTHCYSYAFKGGHDETVYGKKIANVCNFPFEAFKVPSGYLWDSIDRMANFNQCYSEFTHPRQMAFIDDFGTFGDIFSLGHWGDVLFDDMGVEDTLSLDEQVNFIIKKVVKKGGLELAEALWTTWTLQGNFKDYLKQRIRELLEAIDIKDSANARIRAFKSLYWAPRWTSVNLTVFEAVKPITLPYYDNRMCEFICSIPETYLSGRQIQIDYIKLRLPALAKITWQAQRPFNLYNYKYNRVPWNLPYRMFNKFKRTVNTNPLIQRNWELQFLGEGNDQKLKERLFDSVAFAQLVPKKVTEAFYHSFKMKNNVNYSHPVSMLLTLSLFSKTIHH
ncbi:MAG TPA: asparagine synthetase B family protein [Flavobacteriaceae bacterium]